MLEAGVRHALLEVVGPGRLLDRPDELIAYSYDAWLSGEAGRCDPAGFYS